MMAQFVVWSTWPACVSLTGRIKGRLLVQGNTLNKGMLFPLIRQPSPPRWIVLSYLHSNWLTWFSVSSFSGSIDVTLFMFYYRAYRKLTLKLLSVIKESYRDIKENIPVKLVQEILPKGTKTPKLRKVVSSRCFYLCPHGCLNACSSLRFEWEIEGASVHRS
jgi:hypothetical protein